MVAHCGRPLPADVELQDDDQELHVADNELQQQRQENEIVMHRFMLLQCVCAWGVLLSVLGVYLQRSSVGSCCVATGFGKASGRVQGRRSQSTEAPVC
jgi:hypothetical protein